MNKEINKNFDFKIGADPEFSIILQNKRIDAQKTIGEILKNKREFKLGRQGYEYSNYGNIGWDGAAQTGEIRPTAEITPEKVIKNLKKLFNAFGKYMSIFELSTLSQHATIGGHIHIEQDEENVKKQKNIHHQISSFYLPILMSENKINLSLRLRQGYGAITDYRCQSVTLKNNETIKTYEFRTPSAEWLTTPKIATATLAYIATIYHEIINNPTNIKKYKNILLKNENQAEAFQTLAIQEYEPVTKILLKNIAKAIRTFEKYPAYKKEIEFILKPDLVIKEKIKNNYDINNGWELNITNKTNKKTLFSDKKFKEKLKEKDADIISKLVHIDYNDDAKVSEFVNALALRAGAFNWKLSKQYFIFGLKKGVKDIIVKNAQEKYLTGTKQIKTKEDYHLVENAFKRMIIKYEETGAISNLISVDFKTGKTISIKENILFIGLPYELRMKGDIKKLINLVWNIENNKLEKETINIANLTNEKGEIQKNREKSNNEEEQINAIRIDNGTSHSTRNQQNALQDLHRVEDFIAVESAEPQPYSENITNNNSSNNTPPVCAE
jgi:hypothetical protein